MPLTTSAEAPLVVRQFAFGTLGDDQWSAVLDAFGDAVIYQTLAYGTVRWGRKNLSHVVIERDGETIAAGQVRSIRWPPFSFAYMNWGPLFRRRGSNDPEAFRLALGAIRSELVEKRGLCVRLRPSIMEGDAAALAALAEEGFSASRAQKLYQTYMVDLSAGLDVVWKASAGTWRQKTRRAEKNGLEYRCGTGQEFFDVFLRLYDEMHGAKGFVESINVRDFARTQSMLPEPLKMRVALCEKDGEPVSALVFSDIGETAVMLLAASGRRGRELEAGYLMWWRVVEDLAERGVRAFDLGGADPINAPGPARFKHYLAGKNAPLVRHAGHFEAGGSIGNALLNTGASAKSAYRRLKTLGARLRGQGEK